MDEIGNIESLILSGRKIDNFVNNGKTIKLNFTSGEISTLSIGIDNLNKLINLIDAEIEKSKILNQNSLKERDNELMHIYSYIFLFICVLIVAIIISVICSNMVLTFVFLGISLCFGSECFKLAAPHVDCFHHYERKIQFANASDDVSKMQKIKNEIMSLLNEITRPVQAKSIEEVLAEKRYARNILVNLQREEEFYNSTDISLKKTDKTLDL